MVWRADASGDNTLCRPARADATRSAFRRLRPDIVHAHTPKGGLLGILAARIARVPVRIYHIHGLPFESATGLRRRILWASEWLSCHLASKVLCVSRSALLVAEQEGVCPQGKGEVLRMGSINGVDAELFSTQRTKPETDVLKRDLGIASDARVVGFVGRIVRDKGIEDLTTAWQHLRTRFPDAHLVVVGAREDEDPVDPSVLRRLEADERAHLLGFTSDPAPAYGLMTVLALPSHREGFGLAALEAAAMEVPVVASRIAGLVDAVADGETGTLVPSGDCAALAEGLHSYLSDRERCRNHGLAGRRRASSDFNPLEIWASLREYYQRITTAVPNGVRQ